MRWTRPYLYLFERDSQAILDVLGYQDKTSNRPRERQASHLSTTALRPQVRTSTEYVTGKHTQYSAHGPFPSRAPWDLRGQVQSQVRKKSL